MRIWEVFKFLTLAFVLAGYGLLALLMFARLLSALVSHHRAAGQIAKGLAHVNRPDQGANVVFGKRDKVSSKNRPDWSQNSV